MTGKDSKVICTPSLRGRESLKILGELLSTLERYSIVYSTHCQHFRITK